MAAKKAPPAAIAPLSDIARNYGSATPGGVAIDGRPESPRPYPPGQEKAHNGNANLARHGGDKAQ